LSKCNICILALTCTDTVTIDHSSAEIASALLGESGAIITCADGYMFTTQLPSYHADCMINAENTGVYWNTSHIPQCAGINIICDRPVRKVRHSG